MLFYLGRKQVQQAHRYMNIKQIIFVIGIVMALSISTLQAHDDIKEYYHLKSSDIIAVFAGKTLHSINQRTKAKILTYLAKDGTVKQSIKSSNIQRNGWWHAANNQLCLRWQKFGDEHCFDKVLFHDEVFYLTKDNQVETVVDNGDEGDTTGF